MKTLLPLLVAAVLVSNVWAGVSAHVYLADEQTPLALSDPNVPGLYRDIMVGTRLTIFVSSDTDESWAGGLYIPWAEADAGTLYTRGDNNEGSALEAAGVVPLVLDDRGPMGEGVQLGTVLEFVAGDWFVLDYRAEQVGACRVELREYAGGQSTELVYVLLDSLFFNHVPSRDFDGDAIVNFVDFAIFASEWGQGGDPVPGAEPAVDLNADATVNAQDMALFCEYWLERTDFNEPDAAGPQ